MRVKECVSEDVRLMMSSPLTDRSGITAYLIGRQPTAFGLWSCLLRGCITLRCGPRDIGVVTRSPRESFTEIRAAASRILPTARARRRFYYRYTLIWDRPVKDS